MHLLLPPRKVAKPLVSKGLVVLRRTGIGPSSRTYLVPVAVLPGFLGGGRFRRLSVPLRSDHGAAGAVPGQGLRGYLRRTQSGRARPHVGCVRVVLKCIRDIIAVFITYYVFQKVW